MALNDWGRVLISVIVTIGFMGILVLVIVTKTQGNAPTEVMLVMLGALGSAFGQVVSYWVGSSSGSSQKDNALQKMAEKT
jgi:membrane protein DedA with SNARE-associated domain